MGLIYTFLASSGELFMIWGLKQPRKLVTFGAWTLGTIISGYFLNLAFQLMDTSSAYPLWVSIGSIGALILGTCLYGEQLSKKQSFYILLLIVGCIGLSIKGI